MMELWPGGGGGGAPTLLNVDNFHLVPCMIFFFSESPLQKITILGIESWWSHPNNLGTCISLLYLTKEVCVSVEESSH